MEAAKNDAEGTKIREDAEQKYSAALDEHAKCVVDAVPHQPYYAAAVDQARALAERLVGK